MSLVKFTCPTCGQEFESYYLYVIHLHEESEKEKK